jgi:hypothetical protein
LPTSTLRLSWSKFCSNRCAKQAAAKLAPKSAYPNIPSPSVGAIHELQVGADLLARGFQVFTALRASADCDLAVLIGKKLVRLEVTTGYKAPSGKISFPNHNPERYDALAVVIAKEMIHYFPPPDQWA